MSRRHLSLLVVFVSVVAACGSPSDPETASSTVATGSTSATTTTSSSTTTMTTATSVGVTEWESNGMVIHVPDGDPVICALSVATSLPPQCGGPVVVGLDWGDVPWVEEAQGVRWAAVRLIGTFDGTTFTLTQEPGPIRYRDEEPFDTTPPCPEPDGGWVVFDESTAENDSAAVQYAQAQPGFLGNWVHRLPSGSAAYSVKVFTFAEDVERHRSELRSIYGGPLCVAEAPLSYEELDAIRQEVREVLVGAEARAAGIYATTTDTGRYAGGDTVDIINARVEVLVFAAAPGAQEWLDDRFGEGIVRIDSQLEPYGG